MGSGIAQVAATKGLEVVLCDNSTASLERGLDAITKSLQRIVRKGGLLQEDADKAIGQIKCVDDLAVSPHCLFL
jgi:3-hydroxybutyryl-CoA dehydrogenase